MTPLLVGLEPDSDRLLADAASYVAIYVLAVFAMVFLFAFFAGANQHPPDDEQDPPAP